eukprot:362226-Chlamydomonas_euryale.AAC.6
MKATAANPHVLVARAFGKLHDCKAVLKPVEVKLLPKRLRALVEEWVAGVGCGGGCRRKTEA